MGIDGWRPTKLTAEREKARAALHAMVCQACGKGLGQHTVRERRKCREDTDE